MAKKQTKTATFTAAGLNITSKWQCTASVSAAVGTYLMPKGQPTLGTGSRTIHYSIPSGAKIKSAKLTASKTSPFTGIGMLTMNGGNFTGSANVTLTGTSGDFVCTFAYRAYGNKVDAKPHVATIQITNITLSITYEENAEGKQPKKPDKFEFRIPPQSIAIYDQEKGKIYTFDGVVKQQQQLSMKIEEDPSKKKSLYVNNARNEPDKVTLDVMMSDVYTGGGNLVVGTKSTSAQQKALTAFKNGKSGESRSEKAVGVLHELKESRRLLSVVTPQYVYTDMLIQNITITQDETTPFGWQGQITLQEKYEVEQKKDVTASDPKAENPETRTESEVYGLFTRIGLLMEGRKKLGNDDS